MIKEKLRSLLAIVLRFPSFGLCSCAMCVVPLGAIPSAWAQESLQIQVYGEGSIPLLSRYCGGFLLASPKHLVCS